MDNDKKRSKLHKKMQTILAAVNLHDKKPLSLAEARESMTRVQEIFQQFEVVQAALESTCIDDSALLVQAQQEEAVEKTFSDVRGKLRVIVDQLSATPSSSGGSGTGGAGGTTMGKVKLPVVSLPIFEGCYETWISFKDLFTAQVGSKPELSGAQKLQYLKSALKGDPLDLVDDLPTTDSNYLEAWKILKERYEIKREIVRAHVSKIMKMKSIKNENATELQGLIDGFVKHLRCLTTMGCHTDQWDDLTVVMVEEKLDAVTRREWAKLQTGVNPPTFDEFKVFINGHIRGLQAAGSTATSVQLSVRRGEKAVRVHHVNTEGKSCIICKGSHWIHECKEFLSKSPAQRSELVKSSRLCFNCLRADHMFRNCTSNRKCKKCGRQHNTLLHEDRGGKPGVDADKIPTVTGNHVEADSRGIVMTVLVNVPDKYGMRQLCRAFVDPGATADFISESCANRLKLNRQAGCVNVKGFGDTPVGKSKGIVKTTLHSRINNNHVEVELHVLTKLTVKCHAENWKHLEGLSLADPKWHQPGAVDIVLGIKYFHKLMLTQRRVGPNDDAPVAWETIFGWVVAGACPIDQGIPITSLFHVTIDPINQQLQKFWEMEEPWKRRILTMEEKQCEEHFLKNYTRDQDGRRLLRFHSTRRRRQHLAVPEKLHIEDYNKLKEG